MLTELGLYQAESDWGVFYAHIGLDILLLACHVDDCTVTGSNHTLIQVFKQEISECFKITDLGLINWLLGMKVTHNCVT